MAYLKAYKIKITFIRVDVYIEIKFLLKCFNLEIGLCKLDQMFWLLKTLI